MLCVISMQSIWGGNPGKIVGDTSGEELGFQLTKDEAITKVTIAFCGKLVSSIEFESTDRTYGPYTSYNNNCLKTNAQTVITPRLYYVTTKLDSNGTIPGFVIGYSQI